MRSAWRAPLAAPTVPFETDAPAVYLRRDLYIQHHPSAPRRTTYEQYEAISIRKEAGLVYAAIEIPIAPIEELLSVEARTTLPSGEVIALLESQITIREDVDANGRAIRVHEFRFPGAGVGALLERRWIVSVQGTYLGGRLALDGPLPVLEAKLEAKPTHVGVFAEQLVGFRRLKSDGRVPPTNVFVLESPFLGAPALGYLPPGGEWIPQVGLTFLGEFKRDRDNRDPNPTLLAQAAWNSLGQWLWNRQKKDDAAALPALATEKIPEAARISLVWNHVQRTLRNGPTAASVRSAGARQEVMLAEEDDDAHGSESRDRVYEWGAGRPMDRILQSGEANTTERSRLMLALLKRAGVTAVPMLVQHPDHPKVDGLLPYASLWTGDTLVWIHGTAEPLVLDPSCLGCAPGEIAPEHHGLIGVVMEPAEETVDVESTLGHAPSVGVYLKRGLEGGLNFVVLRTTAGDQPSSYEATIDWMQDGLRLRRGEWQLHGPDAGRVRWLFHANGERAGEARLREALAIPKEGGRIHAEGLPEVGDVLRVQAEEIPLAHAPIVRTPSGYELRPSDLFPRAELFDTGPPRALDLHFGRRAPLHSTLRIAAAPGCTWAAPPAPIRIENELGEYRSMAEVTEGALVLREAILVFAERIPPARQAEWTELGEAVRRARSRSLASTCRTPPR